MGSNILYLWHGLTIILTCASLYTSAVQKGKCPKSIIQLTETPGAIQNHGYPYSYKRKQLCIYHIRAPSGYRIRITFEHLELGERNVKECSKKDHIMLSTKRLYFQDITRVANRYQYLICGNNIPSKDIVTHGNHLWIRFSSDRNRFRDEKGFRLTYRFLDYDECKSSKPYCQHICKNIVGGYDCKCYHGYVLKNDLKTCAETYLIFFKMSTFEVMLMQDNLKVGFKFLSLQPTILNINGTIKKKSPHFKLEEHTWFNYFMVDEHTGDISILKKPPMHTNSATLTVKVTLPYAAPVELTVNIKIENALNKKFKVLIPHHINTKKPVFFLKPHYRHLSPISVNFKMNEESLEFRIKRKNGKIYLLDAIKQNVDSSIIWQREITVAVTIFNEFGLELKGTADISFIQLPLYPGENFVTSEILNEVATYIENGNLFTLNQNKNKVLNSAGLHRFLRMPSKKAQEVSKSKLFFDEVFERVHEKVQQSFGHGNSSTNPVIIHLSTGKIVSSKILDRVIDASKCKEKLIYPDCTSFVSDSSYQTFDGSCNNLNNPLWGAAPIGFKRLLPALYYDADGLAAPIGFPDLFDAPKLPSAHHVSKTFFKVHNEMLTSKSPSFSHMLMQWGQFVDHDITMTAESEGAHRCIFPRCDGSKEDFAYPCFPMFYENNLDGCSMFVRSAAVCQTNSVQIEKRQQMNTINSYLDASMVYGSNRGDANALRMKDGSGKLKVSVNDYLPLAKDSLHPPLSFCKDFGGCFKAGDVRVNEQVALTSMHTLWVREHNMIATIFKKINPIWDNEKIYLETRKIISAIIQHITYTEYLPKVLGKRDFLPKYQGYNPTVDSTISNVFATAAFRFGHSLVQPFFSRLDNNYDKVSPDLPLVNAFFNNTLLLLEGIEPFLFGMIGNVSAKVDRSFADGLTRKLFQRPGSKQGFDLAALNIQRGRDHGLPGYGRWREFCNLKTVHSFDELHTVIKNNEARALLKQLYSDLVYSADVFAAGLAEDHFKDSIVGPLFHCIIKDQFLRLRDGDRFYYEKDDVFTKSQLKEIKKMTLASVMCNSMKGIVSIQKDVFNLFDEKKEKRFSCSSIPQLDLNPWRELENKKISRWTAWYHTKRTPTGTWTLHSNICNINETVADIECQSAANKPYMELNENTQCILPIGVYCRNVNMSDHSCSSYKVRMLCIQDNAAEYHAKRVPTGHPRTASSPARVCKKEYDESDYALLFPTSDENVIESLYHVSEKQEYLYLGKTEHHRKRILLMFDLRRIQRTDILHSATLQLFYTGQSRDTFSRKYSKSTFVEAFLITSTNWNSSYATARVPWMNDFVKVGVDTEKTRLDSVEIVDEKQGWVNLDLFTAVFKWRMATEHERKPNFGVLIRFSKDDVNSGMGRFASSLHENLTIRPKLFLCLSTATW